MTTQWLKGRHVDVFFVVAAAVEIGGFLLTVDKGFSTNNIQNDQLKMTTIKIYKTMSYKKNFK